MAGRKRKSQGFSINNRYYNITKNPDGTYELELGNWTDAGWHWDGDETDLVGTLIRLTGSSADTTEIDEHWDEIKNDALKYINDSSWFYMISGDNNRWQFGYADGDYVYDTVKQDLEDDSIYPNLTEEQKEEIIDRSYDIGNVTYEEFESEAFENFKDDVSSALMNSDSLSDFQGEIEDIRYSIEEAYFEMVTDKVYSNIQRVVDEVMNEFPSELDEDDDRYNPDYIGNPPPKEKSDYIGDAKPDSHGYGSQDERQMNMFSIKKIKAELMKLSYPTNAQDGDYVMFYDRGMKCWITAYGDAVHGAMSYEERDAGTKKGFVFHIGQLRDKPYYNDVKNWLMSGDKTIEGKQY